MRLSMKIKRFTYALLVWALLGICVFLRTHLVQAALGEGDSSINFEQPSRSTVLYSVEEMVSGSTATRKYAHRNLDAEPYFSGASNP